MPAGPYVDLFGWSAASLKPTLSNYNFYQPFTTPPNVQSEPTTYTAYLNMPKSHPKTGEKRLFLKASDRG